MLPFISCLDHDILSQPCPTKVNHFSIFSLGYMYALLCVCTSLCLKIICFNSVLCSKCYTWFISNQLSMCFSIQYSTGWPALLLNFVPLTISVPFYLRWTYKKILGGGCLLMPYSCPVSLPNWENAVLTLTRSSLNFFTKIPTHKLSNHCA